MTQTTNMIRRPKSDNLSTPLISFDVLKML